MFLAARRPASRAMAGPGLPGLGLAFAAGVGWLYLLPALPSWWWPALALALLTPWVWRWPWARWVWAVAAGFAWAQWQACLLLCAPFPDELARVPLVIEGRVASIPVETGFATRFLFEVETAWREDEPVGFRGRVRLSWYDERPPLRAGERWRLPVRLKPSHGYANPGGFDYERWLFEQGVQATGNLRRGHPHARLEAGPGPYVIDRARQWLGAHLTARLGTHRALPLVQALAIGERAGMTPATWDVLTRTGTNHLLAISGLHVGLIAGGIFFLARWSWARSARLTVWLAAPRAAALAGAVAALGYAGLAGFAISTQRALIMLAVVLGALFWQRTLRPFQALTLALLAVLLWDSRAVLSVAFWLSFGAVAALLFYLGQRLPRRDLWTRWGRAQWAVAIGLLPLLLLLFGRASLVAPLVNLVAVPIFSLLVLPLVLVSSLLSLVPGLDAPLRWAADLLGYGLDVLTWIAAWPWAALALPARPWWVWGLAMVGAMLLLAPRGLPGRWLGVPLLLPMLLLRPPAPAWGEVWFTLLDVGLGLAAVVRTQEGTLVYDTGPGFPSGFNAGSAVVAPFLLAQGIDRVERIVVSHGDRDHAGGLPGLLERIRAEVILGGEPDRLGIGAVLPCRAGDGWEWSGVRFAILHPEDDRERGNHASCVLRVETGGQAILLTGDLERRGELALARRLGPALRAEVLVAGHHGSNTSTHKPLLETVAPRWVLFAAGYANHFGFPAPAVRARVADFGAEALDTALLGAITVRLTADGRIGTPVGWRQQAGRLWTHRPRQH